MATTKSGKERKAPTFWSANQYRQLAGYVIALHKTSTVYVEDVMEKFGLTKTELISRCATINKGTANGKVRLSNRGNEVPDGMNLLKMMESRNPGHRGRKSLDLSDLCDMDEFGMEELEKFLQ